MAYSKPVLLVASKCSVIIINIRLVYPNEANKNKFGTKCNLSPMTKLM